MISWVLYSSPFLALFFMGLLSSSRLGKLKEAKWTLINKMVRNTKMKKILFIFESDLFPIDRGNKRTVYAILSTIREMGYFVTLLNFRSNLYTYNDIKDFADQIILFKHPSVHYALRVFNKIFNILFSPVCLFYQNFIYTIAQKIILKSHSINYDEFDFIIVNYLNKSLLIPKSVRKNSFVLTHDIIFYRQNSIYEKRLLNKLFVKITKNVELKYMHSVGRVLVFAQYEKELLGNLSNVSILPPFISTKTDTVCPLLPSEYQYDFGFIGAKGAQNSESIIDFIHDIYLPFFPDSSLVIAGTVCSDPSLQKLVRDHKKILSVGYYEKIEELYPRINIVISILKFGSGVKIKTIEAMSQAALILANKKGLEGIELAHLRSCLDIDQFPSLDEAVGYIKRVLKDPRLADPIRRAAFQSFTDHYSKEALCKSLKEILS